MTKRFTITASKETSFLIDNENELSALPLYFQYNDLDDEDKEKVEKWLDFLNKNYSNDKTVQTTLYDENKKLKGLIYDLDPETYNDLFEDDD